MAEHCQHDRRCDTLDGHWAPQLYRPSTRESAVSGVACDFQRSFFAPFDPGRISNGVNDLRRPCNKHVKKLRRAIDLTALRCRPYWPPVGQVEIGREDSS